MKNRKKYPFCLVYTIKWLITYLDTSFDVETMRLEVINNEKLGKYVASKFETKTFFKPISQHQVYSAKLCLCLCQKSLTCIFDMYP